MVVLFCLSRNSVELLRSCEVRLESLVVQCRFLEGNEGGAEGFVVCSGALFRKSFSSCLYHSF